MVIGALAVLAVIVFVYGPGRHTRFALMIRRPIGPNPVLKDVPVEVVTSTTVERLQPYTHLLDSRL